MKAHVVITFDENRENPKIEYCGQDAVKAKDIYVDIRDNVKAPCVGYARNIQFTSRTSGLVPKPSESPKPAAKAKG